MDDKIVEIYYSLKKIIEISNSKEEKIKIRVNSDSNAFRLMNAFLNWKCHFAWKNLLSFSFASDDLRMRSLYIERQDIAQIPIHSRSL